MRPLGPLVRYVQRPHQSVCFRYPPLNVRKELIRLYRFISYRQSYAHHPAKKRKYTSTSSNGFASTAGDEERQGLMSSRPYDDEGDAFIEMDVLPPRWADVQDEVTDLLREIATRSAELDKLHQKHVLPGFEDEDVKKREEDVIEGLAQEITRNFHKCQAAIQKVDNMVREAKSSGGGVSQGEETMARNIQISLASRVQEASAGFRKRQSNYLRSMLLPLKVILKLFSNFPQNSAPWVGSPLPFPAPLPQ